MLWSCVIVMIWVAGASVRSCHGGAISYDGRSLIIDGQRKILFCGSIHYPRSTPQMWPSLLAKAKEGGLDVIDTYVFWNLHEPHQGRYDFSGRRDIIRFIKEVHAQGLYVCLRIGPFIEGEWTYGGLPFWLHDVPGIIFRSDNGPFKQHMENWVTKIVNMMKEEKLFASEGGPIILSQIENEYHRIEAAFGKAGPTYVSWAAAMAVGLKTGVPWTMCSQQDAPDPVINTCNGMECGITFAGPNSPNKPSIWTENWTSFLQRYGEESFKRTAENIAFHVALFIAKLKGSFVNYYMYHGGTNFGRTAAAYIITSYYDEAPLDEYGLIKEPKWSHLKKLHAAIKLCSEPLLYGEYENFPLGKQQVAFVFRRKSGECAAFLANNDNCTSTRVSFQNSSYDLPPMSISILPDCRNVAFNTAKINTRFTTRAYERTYEFSTVGTWELYQEPIPIFAKTKLRAKSLLDHMSTTKDSTDYLWYSFSFQYNSSSAASVLSVQSKAHILHAFVNGDYAGSARGGGRKAFAFMNTVQLIKGTNKIALLSVMVGFPDSGPYLEHRVAAIRGVRVQDRDFRRYSWGYQVGLVGEQLQVFTENGTRRVQWSKFQGSSPPMRLVWYKSVFDAPVGNGPLALNLGSMGKGEAWVNGESIGRYWASLHTPEDKPSQTWYHVPRSFLKPENNLLVLLEEEFGDPSQISLDNIFV